MTAKSFWWETGVAGDGSSEYSEVDHSRWVRVVGACAGHEGIGAAYEDEFDATANPTGGSDRKVRIGTGGAIVDGKPLDQDVLEDMLLDTTPSYRRDRVVLKADWGAANTVRIAVLKGTDGSETPPNIPAPNPNTLVYQALWQVRIINSGAVTLEADERIWAVPQVDDATIDVILGILGVKVGGIDTAEIASKAVETSKLDDYSVTTVKLDTDAVTSPKIQSLAVVAGKIADGAVSATAKLANDIVDDTKVGNRVPALTKRQGGNASDWSTYGNINYIPTAVRMQAGVRGLTVAAIDFTYSFPLTWPTAFSQPPIVLITLEYAATKLMIVTKNIIASGCTLQISTVDGSTFGSIITFPIHWLAIGPE